MKHWESEALVLRTRAYGESDKLVTLLTLKEGKVAAIARGGRKTKSKLSAAVDSFARGDYLFYRGKSLNTIQQVSIVESFFNIRNETELYFHGLYICELLEKVLEEGHPSIEIYKIALESFYCLNAKENNTPLITRCFELNLLNSLGYCPSLENCLNCGQENSPFFFSASEGGLLCSNCRIENKSFPVSLGSIALMQRILSMGFKGIKKVKLPEISNREITRVCWDLLLYNTEIKTIKSRAFLSQH